MAQMTDEEIIQRIVSLTREEAMEAALALDDRLAEPPVGEPGFEEEAQTFVDELEAQPFAGLQDVEELARVALAVASLDALYRPGVEDILGRVGNKAFIFGGAEIVAAGIVALRIVQTVLAKGKRTEEETTEVSLDDRDQPRIVHRRKTVYATTPKVGQLLSAISSDQD